MTLTHAIKLLFTTAFLVSLCVSAQTQAPSANPNPIRVLLSPELETTLISQMVGRISALNASLGAAVSKGKPIVVFDCSEALSLIHI